MRRFVLVLALLVGAALPPAPADAQHDMARMSDRNSLEVPMARRGSGTSWLPDSSPVRSLDRERGAWRIMVDGAAFGLNNQQQTLHGGAQWAVLDWEMATASRPALGGLLHLSLMTSAESLTLPDSGYHELLQTGEVLDGHRRADMQHAEGPLMELSGEYEHPLTNRLASFAYGGVVGEPALGPPAYFNRPAAEADPFAPIGHHWQDASHESVGVVTGGFFTRALKLEGSVFNAREPTGGFGTEVRGARLDSYAGRLTMLPSGRVALSVWAGYLADDDPLTPGLGMQRYGASILTETHASRGGALSTAVVWGMNVHHHSERLHVHDSTSSPRLSHPTSSILVESTLRVSDRTSIYARAEQIEKMADDFGFLGGDLAQLFTVRTVSIGATRAMAVKRGIAAGVGARAALNLIPAALEPTYQTRHAGGFVVYLTLQPARSQPPGTTLGGSDSSR